VTGGGSQDYGAIPDLNAPLPNWNFQMPDLPTPAYLPAGTTGHWVTPDYSSLLQSDPGYMMANAGVMADAATAARQRASDVRSAIVGFGGTPAGWNNGFGDVDPATLAAAQANPYSTLATIARQRSMGNTDLLQALAGRGIVSSGALTGGQNMLQSSMEQAQQKGIDSLLASLGGYARNYANTMRDLQNTRMGALSDAAGRVQSTFLPTWLSDPTNPAPTTPGTTDPGIVNPYTGQGTPGIDPLTGQAFKAGQGTISSSGDAATAIAEGKVPAGTVGMDLPLAPPGHSMSEYIPDYSQVSLGDWGNQYPGGAQVSGAYPGGVKPTAPAVNYPKIPITAPPKPKKVPSSVPSSIGSYIR